MKISDIDKNFKVPSTISNTDVDIYNVCDKPFEVFGLFMPDENNDTFYRLPHDVAKTVNEGVDAMYNHATGGRVRFKTDSKYIAIHAELAEIGRMPHFALSGSAGFDLYARENGKEQYVKSFIPPYDMENGYESEYYFETSEMREITINFPTYSKVAALYIYLDKGSVVAKADNYKYNKPVVYYGSSITHGGCCSRPGTAYPAIISRMLDCDFINLGFSGSARGETEMAEYIASLDMSVFVLDYDHNAPTAEHLEKTHEPFFNLIRKAKPDLPIICVSSSPWHITERHLKGRDIIAKTVENAKAAGDKNVWFVDGTTMFKLFGMDYDIETVDGCHPNDAGFGCMAKSIGPAVKEALEK